MTYCAFVICSLLDDFTCIDLQKALNFVKNCRTYEGAYGQVPGLEGHGGPTYCSLASLHLVPHSELTRLSLEDKDQTLRWLCHNQVFLNSDETSDRADDPGGFRGRTEKEADACYSFWCCASIEILRSHATADTGSVPLLVDVAANARWIERCAFKWGGIAKTPGETPDPYHTYLSLASIGVFPPELRSSLDQSWAKLAKVDPLINGRVESVVWGRNKLAKECPSQYANVNSPNRK